MAGGAEVLGPVSPRVHAGSAQPMGRQVIRGIFPAGRSGKGLRAANLAPHGPLQNSRGHGQVSGDAALLPARSLVVLAYLAK